MAVKLRNLSNEVRWAIENAGMVPGIAARKSMVYSSTSDDPYKYWSARGGAAVDAMYSTVLLAEAATTSGRNDVVLITPETHSLASALTWDGSDTHLIGMSPGRTFQAHTARITPSANFTPGFTLSGSNNTWANVRLAHPAGDAGNLIGLSVTGHYNYLTNVNLWSPGSTTEGAVATMISLNAAGGNNYFESCTIGGDSRMRAAANCVLNINTSGVQNVFKDCTFMFYTNSADTFFIYVSSGAGVQNRWTLFDNCTFIAYSTNWGTATTEAVKYQYSGGNGHRLLFKDCGFAGVTDVISGDDSYRDNCQFLGGNTYLSATTGTGLFAVST